jgi:hypothetical protein
MNCPAELIWAQYVDDELPEIEARDLAEHLASCLACRKLTSALKNETELLVWSLQNADWREHQPDTAQPSRLAYWAAILIGAAILLRASSGLVLKLNAPSVLDWLSPLSLSGQLNWFSNALFYFIEKGESLMTSLISSISFIMLGLFVTGALVLAMRRAKGLTAIMSLAAILFVFIAPGHAMEVRTAEKGIGTITVSSSETVNDTLVVFADSVDINGTVTGDLIAFARRVNIRGTVQGNVIGFGQHINIAGNVGGDVCGFGQNIQAAGTIGRNLWGFGQNMTVASSCRLRDDAALFGSDVNVEGDIGRDLTTMAGTVDVGSKIGRDFLFRGELLTLRVPAGIGRNLNAMTKSTKGIRIDPGVVIQGNKKFEIESGKPQRSKYLTGGFYFGQLLRIAAAFVMGLLLFWLFPGIARTPLSTAKNALKSGGIGFLAAVATPIAAVILAITMIGIPIALTALVLWLFGLYLAKILIARCIGDAIFANRGDKISTVLGLLIGIVIVVIAVNLPYVGGILNFILILIGFGGLVLAAWSGRRRRTEPTVLST